MFNDQFSGVPGGQSTPEMEHSYLHPPPAGVRTLTGYKIPKVNPGQPRIDPRAAMRPSAAPRTPPKTFRKEEGASRKRKRENSRTPGSSEQPNPPAGRGREGGRQPSTPALHEEPRPDSINNRGGKSSRGPKNCRKAGGHLKTPLPRKPALRELVSKWCPLGKCKL